MSKKYAFIFPGQGSQTTGMGKDLYEQFEQSRTVLNSANEVLDFDLKKAMFEGENLDQTEVAQSAILTTSLMALEAFKSKSKLVPTLVLGHSLGEITAVCAAGAMASDTGAKLVNKRGLLMKDSCKGKEASMMVILGLSDKKVAQLCAKKSGVYTANFNCECQVVVGGFKTALEEMVNIFKTAGAKRAMLLNMNVASHCPLMQEASEKIVPLLEQAIAKDFNYPVVSNVNAKKYNNKNEVLKLLSSQLIKPVLYSQSIKNVENEVDGFIEFGAGKVLASLNKKNSAKPTLNVFDAKSLEATIGAL